MKKIKADIAIIGGGSGGLSVAAGAAQLGANVVLFEKHKMGGDCLNFGCVPSKALIAAGGTARTVSEGARFGVNGHSPEVNFRRVHDHVHDVIAGIAPHDSVERFEGLGVTVIKDAARFTGPGEIEGGGAKVTARRFVIATGSSAFVPPIDGLKDVRYLTNETIFDLTEAPDHLVVVGGGPIGLELAQAHRRLGCRVTVVEAFSVLPKDDPDAAGVVRARLCEEGVRIHEFSKVERVTRDGNAVAVCIARAGNAERIKGTHVLIAAGRRPNVNGLNLENAGIKYSHNGIGVDARLRTTNRRVFAIGDVAGGYQFTHMAGYHAGIVIRNALFNLPAKVDYRAVPWVTFTDPELAHVGLTEAAAKEMDGRSKAASFQFGELDRARTERETDGLIKMVVNGKGRIAGATIAGRHAGELILPWVIAVQKGLKPTDMAGIIAPYPTLSEISKRVAGAWFTASLFSERTRRVVRLMQRLP